MTSDNRNWVDTALAQQALFDETAMNSPACNRLQAIHSNTISSNGLTSDTLPMSALEEAVSEV
jgi:hypothetical protein